MEKEREGNGKRRQVVLLRESGGLRLPLIDWSFVRYDSGGGKDTQIAVYVTIEPPS